MISLSEHTGIGINYRNELSHQILNNLKLFDFIEINTESFYNNNQNENKNKLSQNIPILLHGLTLSIGTCGEKIPDSYMNNLKHAVTKSDCRWFSEHIAITKVQGLDLRSLMPVEFTEQNVDEIAKKVTQIKSITTKPFLLENISYYYPMPSNSLSEAEFISQIIKSSDCGLLLDLNNLYVNSINHQYDPYKFIRSLPLDRIVEIHLAGCDYIKGLMVDTHASRVKKEVISLFEYLYKLTPVRCIIIERDDRSIDFQEII